MESAYAATLPPRERRLAGRLEGFGDIVFGFAVSQCAIQLPLLPRPQNRSHHLMIIGYLYATLLTALTVLSIKTLVVLKGAAPFTSAGWVFTILYDCTATAEIATHTHAPFAVAYVFLVALVVAFAVAGVRDEAQADPWWWPRALGLTRAERRIASDPR